MKRPPAGLAALLLLAAPRALAAAGDDADSLLARGRALRVRALDALGAPASPSAGITVDEAVERARRLRAAHARGEAVPATEQAAEAVESDEAARQRQVRSLLVAGQELMAEMEALHRSLAGLQDLIQAAEIPAEDEIVSRTVKLVRRVRSLVHASHAADPEAATLRRRDRRAQRMEERKTLRAGGIGSGEVGEVMEGAAPEEGLVPAGRELEGQPGMEDYVTRKLADTTITFPECKELFLEDCIDVLNAQMVELAMDLDIIIHEKRAQHQEGYHKVVLVTDLTGTYVKGKLHDGMVDYPFLWEDSVTGYAHQLGVNGQWDCHSQTPAECCAQIQASCPNPDVRGNMIACHIFVPFGGVGNRKTDERVFVNLSPDGRVQEAPYVA